MRRTAATLTAVTATATATNAPSLEQQQQEQVSWVTRTSRVLSRHAAARWRLATARITSTNRSPNTVSITTAPGAVQPPLQAWTWRCVRLVRPRNYFIAPFRHIDVPAIMLDQSVGEELHRELQLELELELVKLPMLAMLLLPPPPPPHRDCSGRIGRV